MEVQDREVHRLISSKFRNMREVDDVCSCECEECLEDNCDDCTCVCCDCDGCACKDKFELGYD